jgi:hypothetical protein
MQGADNEPIVDAKQLLTLTNPLEAEFFAAQVLAASRLKGLKPEMSELFFSTVVAEARTNPAPETAALLRALAAVGSPAQRRLAIAGLGVVTNAGHFPPEWAGQVGAPTPGQAWRRFDVFGDAETIAVTFKYGDAEHGVAVWVDHSGEPVAEAVVVVPEAAALNEIIHDLQDHSMLRVEAISLAEARRRIEPVLTDDGDGAGQNLNEMSLFCLPIIRARIRRLPVDADQPAEPTSTAADRNMAVAEFLASPYASGAGEDAEVRFWAQVLTGYSGWMPNDVPLRVGPLRLSEMLLTYVPNVFVINDAQRAALPAAVTAWTRWAADRQGLDEAAVARLDEHLLELFAIFDTENHRPDRVLSRGYFADVSATTADGAVLRATLTRRGIAVPPPEEDAEQYDVADPATRRAIIEAEYADCEPPDGMTRIQFLGEVVRVAEQLWCGEPPEVWQVAQVLSADGLSSHQIIHELVARGSGDQHP